MEEKFLEPVRKLDVILADSLLPAGAPSFQRLFKLSTQIVELRSLLTPAIMEKICALQNNPLGFLTDRPTGYDMDTIRDCTIWATCNGLSMVGNQVNIIAGRGYATKEGLKQKLLSIQGLSFSVVHGIPTLREQGAVVTTRVEWQYNGEKSSQELTLPIRVNKGMGADAVLGKATRKAYAWLLEKISGTNVADGEASDMVDIRTGEKVKRDESKIFDTNREDGKMFEVK